TGRLGQLRGGGDLLPDGVPRLGAAAADRRHRVAARPPARGGLEPSRGLCLHLAGAAGTTDLAASGAVLRAGRPDEGGRSVEESPAVTEGRRAGEARLTSPRAHATLQQLNPLLMRFFEGARGAKPRVRTGRP